MNKYLTKITEELEKVAGDGRPKSDAWMRYQARHVELAKNRDQRIADEKTKATTDFKQQYRPAIYAAAGTGAGVGTLLAQAPRPKGAKLLAAGAIGAVAGAGLGSVVNRLTKKAFDLHSQHAKELQDTAVIGGLGGLTGMASHRILSGLKNKPNNKIVFGVSTGMGLAADYAGIKLNKALDSLHNKKEQNVPL